jgi:ribosomal 50S subunit-recycling heat shock protein
VKSGSSEPPTMRAVIPVTLAGLRSDQALAWVFPEYSRTTLKSWILAGRVQVDGRCVAPRHVVSGGEAVELAPPRRSLGVRVRAARMAGARDHRGAHDHTPGRA